MENRTRNAVRIEIIPARLRAKRLQRFLTPEQLSSLSGVAASTIRAAEGTKRSVHLSTVQKLAEALKCSEGDISEVVEDVA